jgi:hypothetical protein
MHSHFWWWGKMHPRTLGTKVGTKAGGGGNEYQLFVIKGLSGTLQKSTPVTGLFSIPIPISLWDIITARYLIDD